MYRFLDLSQDEVHQRRLVLDKYGFVPQLSAICLLALVALKTWLFPSSSQSRSKASYQPLSSSGVSEAVEMLPRESASRERSPNSGAAQARLSDEAELRASQSGSGLKAGNSGLGAKSSVTAWLDAPVAMGWKETRRQVLSVGAWALWLGVLAVRETGEDYLHLTKRFGHIAASLLPFHYLLGTPSRLSPLPFLFRTSGSSAYNAYHRLHAMVLLTLLSLHTCFYLNFYVQKGMWWVFSTQKVIMGACMITTISVIAVMSREKVRRGWRPGFLWVHVAGAGIFLAFLWFHVGVARWYAAEAAVVFATGLFERGLRYRKNQHRAE